MGRLPHAYLVFYFTQKEVRYVESIINDNTTHDPEDYEAIHDHLADEDDIYNESYIISKKNYEINMDKWKPGTPLWITGSSGDGKSTYANQLAKEKKAFLVPLDLFLVRIAKPKEKYDKFLNDTSGTVVSNGSQMVLDYINKHPEIPWADNVKGNWGTSGQDPELWNGLFDWLIDASAKNPKYKTKLIIFEGCNICLMPVEKAVKFPFIIMGTSRLQSSIRRIKRDKKEHDDYSIFKLVYRELKRSTKGVLPSLNKTKDNFEKGLKKQMKTINESYVIQESQQLIQRNLSKLDYDPKTQTVDSHIKDAKTGKNFRIKLIVDDNHPYFKTEDTPAAAYYANADTVEEYLDKSLVLVKSRLLSMRNNASVAIINHEIGHVIDKLHKYWPDRLTPEDVKKLDKLRAATNEVFENTDKSKLNKHDRVVSEPFADAFASNYVSTHALYQGLKTKKGDANKEYAELKQLRKEFEKLRKKFPLEEQKKIEAEINGLENKLSPLHEKRNELEGDAWDNPGIHDTELEEIRQQMEPIHEKIDNLRRNELKKFNEVRMKEYKIKENRDDHQTLQKRLNRNDMTKKIQAKMNQESCLIMDNDEFFMESQATRNKVLERLDYDPKTQTIDTGIKKKNGDHIRVKFKIGTDTAGRTEIPTSSKAYFDIDDYLKDVKIVMGRKYVNQKNNAPLATVYHEIGHIAVALTREYPHEIDGSTKELLDKIRKHVANSYDDIKQATLNDHDSSLEEHHADTYGTTKTSGHANRKSIEKIYNQHINDAYADYKKAKKLLEQIKNRKELSNEERKKIRETERDLDDQIFDLRDEIKNLDTKLDDALTEDEANSIMDKIDEFNKNIRSIEKTQESLRKRITQSEYRVKNDLYYAGVMHDRAKDGMRLRSNIPSSFKESHECLIMDNEEFFMEASKNPDIKARKRTVKNLRRIGVDRAHEVDNKKMIDKLERQIADLEKKWKNDEMSFSDYYDATQPLKKQIRKLEEGIDIEITDSYGKKHKTKLSSNNQTSDSYWEPHDIINITPETMKSNHFDSTFNHEAGHTEQAKRIGFDNLKQRDYTVSDKDDYIIKCAKLFLQKNVDKMNSHDDMWTELHADIISCKKSGYGKMIKDVYSFKKSKTELENAIDDCIKRDEEYRKKLENEHITVRDENGEKQIASQKDVDECIALYEEMQAKLDHSFEILDKRYEALEKQKFFGPWDMTKEYKTKLDKIYKKVKEKRDELYSEKNNLKRKFMHKGITAKDAKEYNKSMETHLKYYAEELEDLKKGFTTYDYRIKFMEDMKHIHEGHPERCSMKYPPMTPEDKKYMQEAECILVSNEEFFEETYKPFDEYLKLNHYDPKTSTIDASNEYHYGQRKSDKRRPIGMPHSKKQWNRINKFLRENDYDPKTETIRTDVVDPKTGKKRRIKFNLTDNFFNMKNHKTHAYFRYNDKLENPEKDGERDLSINMQPQTMAVKPKYSNFTLKHEEGHLDDYLAQLFNSEHLNEIRAIKQMALDFDAEQEAAGNYDKLTNKNEHDRQSREHYADWYGAKNNPYDNSPNGVHLADGFNQTHDQWKRNVVSEKGGNKKDIGELIETLAKSGPANFENNVKDLNLSDKDKAKLRAAVVNYARTKAEDRNLNSQKQLDKEKIYQQDDYKQMKSELKDIEKKLTESMKNKNSEDSEYFKNKYLELEQTFKDTFKPAEQSLDDEYSEKRKQLRDKLEEDIKAFSEELNNKTRKRLENASNKEKHKNAVAMANKRYAAHDQGTAGREKFVNYANEKLKENPNAKINKPVDDWLKPNVKTESSSVLVSNEEFFGLMK